MEGDPKSLHGYVALIDVLGFRELVGRDNELVEIQKYIQTIVSLLEEKEQAGALEFVLFSDNLVINTQDDSEDNFKRLVVACSRISFSLIKQFIAVRGAISRGRFIRSRASAQGVILAGRPIVEAEEYQHRQDWVGIMLAPSAVRGREELLQQSCVTSVPGAVEGPTSWIQRNYLAMHLQRYGGIPFHPGDSAYDGYAVVPIEREALTSPTAITASLSRTISQLEKMKSAAPDPESQAKFRAACHFLYTTTAKWNFSTPWQ